MLAATGSACHSSMCRGSVIGQATSDVNAPAAAAARTPGTSVYFDTVDPLGKRLHAAAQVGSIPGREKPVVFMAAENRESIDEAANRFIAVIVGALVVLGAGLILPEVRGGDAFFDLCEFGFGAGGVKDGSAGRWRGAPGLRACEAVLPVAMRDSCRLPRRSASLNAAG